MFWLNLKSMIFLLEFQGLGLFRHSTAKIQGTGKKRNLNYFGYFRFMSPSRDAQSLHEVLNAVIFMRGLILLHAWVEMVLFSMHLIYLEVLCHPLSHLIWDLLDFSLLILYGS